nr:hypothetical protein [Tanacetum cinerariifolium]
MKRKGVGTQKESMICCVKFMTKISKRITVLTEEILNALSALTYCRPLDATTLREMIGSNKRLIAEDPAPGVPRVAMPILSCLTINDLYDRVGRMKIRQGRKRTYEKTVRIHIRRLLLSLVQILVNSSRDHMLIMLELLRSFIARGCLDLI